MDLILGEYICKECNGTGLLNSYRPKQPLDPIFIVYDCTWCEGSGKADWVTNIVGKKGPFSLNRRSITKVEYNEIKSR